MVVVDVVNEVVYVVGVVDKVFVVDEAINVVIAVVADVVVVVVVVVEVIEKRRVVEDAAETTQLQQLFTAPFHAVAGHYVVAAIVVSVVIFVFIVVGSCSSISSTKRSDCSGRVSNRGSCRSVGEGGSSSSSSGHITGKKWIRKRIVVVDVVDDVTSEWFVVLDDADGNGH